MAQLTDVTIVGQALESFGFTANDTIAGIGLNSFGFLWPCDAIWSPCDPTITTTWTSCIASGSTNVEVCID